VPTTPDHSQSGQELSLRERKKARTRRQLVEVSHRLFLTQGFEETTLEQICAEVEVRTPTLLRYFPTKVELALAPSYDSFEQFRHELAAREEDASVIEVWRRHTLTMSALADGTAMPYYRMLWSSSLLMIGMAGIMDQYEQALAVALSQEDGADPATDLYGRLIATLLVKGTQSIFRAWLRSGRPSGLPDATLAVVDFARSRIAPRDEAGGLPSKRRVSGPRGSGRRPGVRPPT
jgi:AcrR family transcriptional regulator